jgi:hypothetical protein
MNAIDTTKTDLHWNVLTIKGRGLVRDLPPALQELVVEATEWQRVAD